MRHSRESPVETAEGRRQKEPWSRRITFLLLKIAIACEACTIVSGGSSIGPIPAAADVTSERNYNPTLIYFLLYRWGGREWNTMKSWRNERGALCTWMLTDVRLSDWGGRTIFIPHCLFDSAPEQKRLQQATRDTIKAMRHCEAQRCATDRHKKIVWN